MVDETNDVLGKEQLINSIVALVENLDKTCVIKKLLNRFDEVDLKEILQSIVDPLYDTKQQVFTKPERFCKVGKLDLA